MGPLDLEIAYKLYMGSQKDIEDAVHLYKVLKEIIDKDKLNKWFIKLKVKKEFIKELGD